MSHHTVKLAEQIQAADWQKEKHAPAIECPDAVKPDEFFEVKLSLGKAAGHPNTTEHHIRWVACLFSPEDDKFTYEVGRFEFNAHGESAAGANQGPVYTHHEVSFGMKVNKPGTLHALSLCNIHGLWESIKRINLG